MKLPVFKAFGATLGLVFSRLGILVQIAWLPMLALTGASFWLLWNIAPLFSKMIAISKVSSPEELAAIIGPLGLPILLVFVVALVFMPMLFAGLLRYIVRGERPSGPFYLHFGGDELRVLGTYIVIFLINLGVGIGFAILSGATIPLLGGKETGAAIVVQFLLELARLIVSVWISLRLSLAFPAAVGQRVAGVGAAWRMTKGNSWELFGYWLLWYIALLVATALIVSPFLPGILAFCKDFMAVAADDAAAREFIAGRVRALSAWSADHGSTLWIAAAIYFAISTVITIVQVAAAGVAYRLIKADGADAHES